MRNNVAFVGAMVVNLGLRAWRRPNRPNPALNNPDRRVGELFMTVNANAASAGNNNALFETWASDGDTFRPSPAWPSGGAQMQIGPRALSLVACSGFTLACARVLPGGEALVGEETRRNKPDFDFIVQNKLFKVSGLRTAFEALSRSPSRSTSIEVKANWVEVGRLREFNGFTGTPAEARAAYHVNSTGGIQSTRSSHFTSYRGSLRIGPGRLLNTRTTRGDATSWLQGSFRRERGVCRAALRGRVLRPTTPIASRHPLFSRCSPGPIDPAFLNYCLKGSQTDFTDPSGLAIRLGNSVTEQTFVAQASCMTCHGRAALTLRAMRRRLRALIQPRSASCLGAGMLRLDRSIPARTRPGTARPRFRPS